MFKRITNWFYKLFTRAVLVPAPPSVFPELAPSNEELEKADSKGMVKLAIIVGHEKSAQGARMVGGMYEYEYNKRIANMAVEYARTAFADVLQVEIILRDGIGINGTYARARQLLCDAAIELHFNAFDSKVRGTETLCTPDLTDVQFAHIVHGKVCQAFQRIGASRGVKTISKAARGGGNVHAFPGGVNCLVEPFFGDNLEDAKIAMSHQEIYAEALIDSVILWARKSDLIAR